MTEREKILIMNFPIQNPTTDFLAYSITGYIGQTQAPSAGPNLVSVKLTAGTPKAECGLSAYLWKVEVLSLTDPTSSPSPFSSED